MKWERALRSASSIASDLRRGHRGHRAARKGEADRSLPSEVWGDPSAVWPPRRGIAFPAAASDVTLVVPHDGFFAVSALFPSGGRALHRHRVGKKEGASVARARGSTAVRAVGPVIGRSRNSAIESRTRAEGSSVLCQRAKQAGCRLSRSVRVGLPQNSFRTPWLHVSLSRPAVLR
ncbi:hypothetical protein MTO96_003503 [Rhipicephalus appendiculatus]